METDGTNLPKGIAAFKRQNFRWDAALFYALLAAHLLYIWYQQYFLTVDGPAHVYNSKMLLDFFFGNARNFYCQYYDLNLHFYPNLFTHIALAFLQVGFSPVVAEKILMSMYVLLFAGSFIFLSRQLARSLSFVGIVVFPLCFHFLAFYGFYNYCYSLCFSMLFIGCWWRWRDENIPLQMLVLLPLSVLIYVTHIFGWFFIGLSLSGIFIVEIIETILKASGKKARRFIRHWICIALSGAIPVTFSVLFIGSQLDYSDSAAEEFQQLWESFSNLKMLLIYSKGEQDLIYLWIGFVLVLFLYALVCRVINKQKIILADGILISFIIALAVYLMHPKLLSIPFWIGRLSWIPWLLLVLWICVQQFHKVIYHGAILISVGLSITFLLTRYPYQEKISAAQADYLSACSFIPDGSTVLPLSFSHNGLDEQGNAITTKIWLFPHAFDYCGSYKTLINFANYEGNTPWFPFQWKKDCSPFKHLERIEYQPPSVQLNGYEGTNCDFQIDYIVTWCMKFNYAETEESKSLLLQLHEGYNRIYESPTQRTEVWKRKDL